MKKFAENSTPVAFGNPFIWVISAFKNCFKIELKNKKGLSGKLA
jgi:hypothetical protein